MHIISLALAAAIAAAPAQAGQNQNTAMKGGVEVASAEQNEEKLTCKRLKITGTRMAERVCLTKKQWEKVEKEAKG